MEIDLNECKGYEIETGFDCYCYSMYRFISDNCISPKHFVFLGLELLIDDASFRFHNQNNYCDASKYWWFDENYEVSIFDIEQKELNTTSIVDLFKKKNFF